MDFSFWSTSNYNNGPWFSVRIKAISSSHSTNWCTQNQNYSVSPLFQRYSRAIPPFIKGSHPLSCRSRMDRHPSYSPLGIAGQRKGRYKDQRSRVFYGISIRLPGEFFIDEDTSEDPQIFIENLREHMRKIRPTPPAHHTKPKVFIYKDLFTCTHVFM